ncbi:MAG: DMT family transporter, partial [Proteobacteria bacterium]|nr:DMT family transporter [Pseudomonadota bacterium]
MHDAKDPSGAQRRAMLAGFGAIALWGSLAALSVLAGPVPPFQMVAMTFAVGAALGIVRARRRGVAWRALMRWPLPVWALGVGGLFGYHALYFAALQLAPPAEANLVNYLWPLLIVLLSAPFAAKKEQVRLGWTHLVGALLGFAGVALLALGRGLDFAGGYILGYALALGCAITWSVYSVLSRRFGETPTDAIAAFCAVAALLSLACHMMFEPTVWPASPTAWAAVLALGIG